VHARDRRELQRGSYIELELVERVELEQRE
jgi:hypothetical protein